jgi:hypothetical protein
MSTVDDDHRSVRLALAAPRVAASVWANATAARVAAATPTPANAANPFLRSCQRLSVFSPFPRLRGCWVESCAVVSDGQETR